MDRVAVVAEQVTVALEEEANWVYEKAEVCDSGQVQQLFP